MRSHKILDTALLPLPKSPVMVIFVPVGKIILPACLKQVGARGNGPEYPTCFWAGKGKILNHFYYFIPNLSVIQDGFVLHTIDNIIRFAIYDDLLIPVGNTIHHGSHRGAHRFIGIAPLNIIGPVVIIVRTPFTNESPVAYGNGADAQAQRRPGDHVLPVLRPVKHPFIKIVRSSSILDDLCAGRVIIYHGAVPRHIGIMPMRGPVLMGFVGPAVSAVSLVVMVFIAPFALVAPAPVIAAAVGSPPVIIAMIVFPVIFFSGLLVLIGSVRFVPVGRAAGRGTFIVLFAVIALAKTRCRDEKTTDQEQQGEAC